MKNPNLGVGLDIGTMNIVSARRNAQGNMRTQSIRDAFLSLDIDAKKMLKLSGVKFIERDGEIIVVGDDALQMAAMFDKEARRPLAAGLISSSESDSLEILGVLVRSVLGEPVEKGEICYYSVPAAPVDSQRDVVYHRKAFERIIEECGYTPHASNEAMAIIYSEANKEGFSGIGISFGCLTPETTIMTRDGLLPIASVPVGMEVLAKDGRYHKVEKVWKREHCGLIYRISLYGNPDRVSLTGNHLVWVLRGGTWQWLPAEQVKRGDIVGEPRVQVSAKKPILHLTEKTTNSAKVTKKQLEWSGNLGRFLGYFLADGHLSRGDVNRKGRYEIFVDFGPTEQAYVTDIINLVAKLFKRVVSTTTHGKAIRCHFSHAGLHAWLDRNCYREGKKYFPLKMEEVEQNVAEGLVVGLLRGDGWVTKEAVHFSNTSPSLVLAFHLLVGRLGLPSTLTKRPPRVAKLKDGRCISGTLPDWCVHVTGREGRYLGLLAQDGNVVRKVRVWVDGGFRCTRVRSVQVEQYQGDVHDLTIEGEPSFVSPCITLHNSGMTNVALSVKAMTALEFSLSRGGDYIDKGVAQSIGAAQSRICTIKEKGIDLLDYAKGDPKQKREREALVFYYQDLMEYALRKIAEQFKLQCKARLPGPIPLIVSGGTSLAGNFLSLFKTVFEKHQSRFPIEISEIRQAKEPLNAVAHGLLIQAMQEE
jgi:hypothetical protein